MPVRVSCRSGEVGGSCRSRPVCRVRWRDHDCRRRRLTCRSGARGAGIRRTCRGRRASGGRSHANGVANAHCARVHCAGRIPAHARVASGYQAECADADADADADAGVGAGAGAGATTTPARGVAGPSESAAGSTTAAFDDASGARRRSGATGAGVRCDARALCPPAGRTGCRIADVAVRAAPLVVRRAATGPAARISTHGWCRADATFVSNRSATSARRDKHSTCHGPSGSDAGPAGSDQPLPCQ